MIYWRRVLRVEYFGGLVLNYNKAGVRTENQYPVFGATYFGGRGQRKSCSSCDYSQTAASTNEFAPVCPRKNIIREHFVRFGRVNSFCTFWYVRNTQLKVCFLLLCSGPRYSSRASGLNQSDSLLSGSSVGQLTTGGGVYLPDYSVRQLTDLQIIKVTNINKCLPAQHRNIWKKHQPLLL